MSSRLGKTPVSTRLLYSDDLFANEINGFGNYGVTSGDANKM